MGQDMKWEAFIGMFFLFPLLSSGGENEWTYVGLYPEMVTDIIVHPNNSNTLCVSAFDVFYDTTREGGIFKTTDHGLTWDTLGFRHYRVNDLAFDPQHPETLWAACDVPGVFRSTDGGHTWENRSEGLYLGGVDNYGARAIAVSPFDSDLLMCGGSTVVGPGWLCRTTNAGELWTRVDENRNWYGKVEFDSIFLGRVYALDGWLEVLWISEDSGATFREISAPNYIHDFALDPFRENWLWGIGMYSFLYSPDLGVTWFEPDTNFPPDPYFGQFVRVSLDRMNTVFATDYGRVFQSEDGGRTWSQLEDDWPTSWSYVDAISVVNNSSTEIWVALYYYGILSYSIADTSNTISFSEPERLGAHLELYPNPATNVIYLGISPEPFSGTFSLYNILGRRVFSVPFSQSNGIHAIGLPDALPSGIYFGAVAPTGRTRSLPVKIRQVIVIK